MVTTDNLVFYLKLDDNAANTNVDDAHASNDGTASNNTSTLTTTGKINSALDFNGSTEYIDMNFAPSNNSGSISLWYKGIENTSGRLYSTFASGLQNGQVEILVNASGFVVADVYNSGVVSVTSTTVVNDNSWHFIAITWASGGNLKVYVDGSTAEDTTSLGSLTSVNTQELWLMRHPRTPTNYAIGTIDEMALNSAEWSSSDIGDLWNSGDGLAYPFLLGWQGKIQGITPGKVQSIAVANISKIQGVS